MRGLLNWHSEPQPIFLTNRPHLFFYALAAWTRVFGFGEIPAHLFQSAFMAPAIRNFHRIARHLAPRLAVWLAAMLVMSPAFVVEQNLMVDVPLLALWLGFHDALVTGRDGPAQTRRFAIAAGYCSAAVLVKYSSLTLVVILLAALLMERRRRQSWVLALSVAAPPARVVVRVFDSHPGALDLFCAMRWPSFLYATLAGGPWSLSRSCGEQVIVERIVGGC